jgi:hypothetical protein
MVEPSPGATVSVVFPVFGGPAVPVESPLGTEGPAAPVPLPGVDVIGFCAPVFESSVIVAVLSSPPPDARVVCGISAVDVTITVESVSSVFCARVVC